MPEEKKVPSTQEAKQQAKAAQPASPELQPKLSATEVTQEKPIVTTEEASTIKESIELSKQETLKNFPKTPEEFIEKVTKGLPLQNEKELEAESGHIRVGDKNGLYDGINLGAAYDGPKREVTSLQKPTPGRMVVFFFDDSDGICSNRMVLTLPAVVVMADDLTASLSVHTLDSRDPIVLRKEIPHASIAPKDSEGYLVKPFWDWPVITR